MVKTGKHRLIPLLVIHVSTYPSQGTPGNVKFFSLSFSDEFADYAKTRIIAIKVQITSGLNLTKLKTLSS